MTSLYASLGARVGANRFTSAGPGTTFTKAVETIDDDHAAQSFGLLSMEPEFGPGTALTAAVEELDPDRVLDFYAINCL